MIPEQKKKKTQAKPSKQWTKQSKTNPQTFQML